MFEIPPYYNDQANNKFAGKHRSSGDWEARKAKHKLDAQKRHKKNKAARKARKRNR